MLIVKQDSNGVKPLLQTGELGYDNFPAGGDSGRVYVGTGSENLPLAKKAEMLAVDSKADTHIARDDNPHGVTKAQVGLSNVEDLAPADMPISSAVQAALNAKANKTNADLLGVPKAPTAAVGTNTTQIATTEYVKAEIVDVSYTKNEVYTKDETDDLLDLKAGIESPIFTGIPEADTAAVGTNTKQLATTEFVKNEITSEVYSKVELDAGQLDNRYYTQTQVDDMLDAQNDASEISYDGTVSELVATNVQDAIDEVEDIVDVLDNIAVKLAGDQTIGDVKTFTSSPIVPSPTAVDHAVNKQYVDNMVISPNGSNSYAVAMAIVFGS